MDTLPDIKMSYGSSPQVIKPDITRYDFGDGYSQRVANGLNSIRNNYNAQWKTLTDSDKNTLNNFFIAKKGVEAFYFKPPLEATMRKYTCSEWQFVPHSGGWFSGTAKFTEEFDL